jgi:DNA-binding LytR/AlgR family response regulator
MVVDDEEPARRRLVRMLAALENEGEGVEVAGEAENGLAAIAALERARPDLLLLDIEMPELDGIELVARHGYLPPVVFVTGHDQHAVRAFDLHAVDYLLKPVRPERLAEALRRARARIQPAADSFCALAAAGRAVAPASVPRIVTRSRGMIRLFDARAVTRFAAAHKYTVFTLDGEEHLCEEALSTLVARLRPYGFIRVHRAELVNRAAITAVEARGGVYQLRLRDGQTVRASRRLVAGLKKELGL